MDLSKLSDADLMALKAGDLSRVSDAGLMALKGKPAAPVAASRSIGMGVMDPIQGGAQLLTKMLPDEVVQGGNQLNNWLADKTGLVARLPEGGVDQQTREREATYQGERSTAGESGVDWWRLGGNVVNPVNLGLGAAAGAARAPMLMSTAVGGLSGLMNPVTGEGDFTTEKLKQGGLGAAGGALAPALVKGVARVVSPKASVNPNVQLLKSEGIAPTIGQTLGGRIGATEEKLSSLPIMGDMISSARGRALDQFNRAAINRAVGKVGQEVAETGQAGVSKAAEAIGSAYDDAARMVPAVRFDARFGADLTQLKGMARSLVPDMRRKFDTELRDVVGGRTSQAGAMLPQTFKKVDSEIGGLAAKYSRSTVASEQELGDAFKQLQALLREQAARQSPGYADALKAANAGYANLVRVEGAAKIGKNNGGVFTPGQLNTAIQTADQSVRKRSVAHGDALMQDLGNAGQSVLGNKVPNSGTFDRAALSVGGLATGFYDPMIPLGLLVGAAAYSQPAQALLRGLVSSRPALAEPVARLLNQSAPVLAPTGGLLGIQIPNQ